jgi:FkbM family methyltransferase
MDILGSFLKNTGFFRGKWRVQRIWEKSIRNCDRMGKLPCGATVCTNIEIPYERQVWLQEEEWGELLFLEKLLSAGDYFIDVGANIGIWTLTAASSVREQGRVFAFEPNPKTFEKLEDNIKRNNCEGRIMAFQNAISNQKGQLNFICEQEHNISRIAKNNEPESILVDAIDLDSFIKNISPDKKITGIKIDTEGNELYTLQGAKTLIDTYSPWLIVEFNTTFLPSNKLNDWDVFQFLSELGYLTYRYDRSHSFKIDSNFSFNGYTNLLFKKKD